jgi:hypothetical protein
MNLAVRSGNRHNDQICACSHSSSRGVLRVPAYENFCSSATASRFDFRIRTGFISVKTAEFRDKISGSVDYFCRNSQIALQLWRNRYQEIRYRHWG